MMESACGQALDALSDHAEAGAAGGVVVAGCAARGLGCGGRGATAADGGSRDRQDDHADDARREVAVIKIKRGDHVFASIDGRWYPVRIQTHIRGDCWQVIGQALPVRFRRLDGSRRTTVRECDIRSEPQRVLGGRLP